MKKLILAVMLSFMLLFSGMAMAATSAIDNLPGGAAVFYWQASPGGEHTLLNIQGVAPYALTVHIAFYDRDSNHMFDIECPLTALDNFGYAITGNGTTVTLTPYSPSSFAGIVNGIGNCTATHMFALAGSGADNLQYGYGTVVVNRIDAPVAVAYAAARGLRVAGVLRMGGDDNNDPRNDAAATNLTVVVPNAIAVRTALVGPSGVYAFNAASLQGFMNMSRLQAENVASVAATTAAGAGWVNVIGADALCGANTVDWNNDASFNAGTVALPDFNGADIHAPELYITNQAVAGTAGIAMNTCTRAGRMRALGSANGFYWARFNVTPGLTDTTLVTVFPANNVNPLNPARSIADGRGMIIPVYDDNEQVVSTTPVAPPEVGLSPFWSPTNLPRPGQTSIAHSTITAGEALVQVGAPMFGYTFTVVGGTRADIYPLVKDNIFINAIDSGHIAGGAIADGARINNVIIVGY